MSAVEALAYAGYALIVGLQGALLAVTVALTMVNAVASAALYRPYARDAAVITARWPEAGAPITDGYVEPTRR
ncbi:hypothetical protein [Nocardia fluminea]|uniref:hypothetical protein n=1 Tax=Nocardia fluminea TaxID=134984 RepID=UPI0033C6D7FF